MCGYLGGDRVVTLQGDLRVQLICAEQWPSSIEHVLQPRIGELRCNQCDKHQSRVELRIDDPGIEGNARQDNAGTPRPTDNSRLMLATQIFRLREAIPSD